jgi:hypothetical protein
MLRATERSDVSILQTEHLNSSTQHPLPSSSPPSTSGNFVLVGDCHRNVRFPHQGDVVVAGFSWASESQELIANEMSIRSHDLLSREDVTGEVIQREALSINSRRGCQRSWMSMKRGVGCSEDDHSVRGEENNGGQERRKERGSAYRLMSGSILLTFVVWLLFHSSKCPFHSGFQMGFK